ncbi:hypothetical protein [Cellulomonas sp. PhB143]|uniref:hypothetical protein n=1 Tax=Cellulomonas sp. PhB143 TaxID=2485186 RepID=UPI000F4AA96D|nr:hypothetical protein [Cellulomonas sp. PhB143]ROS72077.1 hypothetical protein EDF32_2821 [Cellulomonas sp. PhB143]
MDLRTGHRTADAASVRARWRAHSLGSIWLRPGDWYHPAVEAITEALTEGRSTVPAAERLGEARGEAGVGIGEAIDDLVCLYRAVGTDPDVPTLRALSTGWTAGAEAQPVAPAVLDPTSGLVTPQYLDVRLAETYAEGERSGLRADRTHCLVMLDIAVEHVTREMLVVREAAVGHILTEAFGAGRPVAALGRGTYAALSERGDVAADRVAAVRRLIDSAGPGLGMGVAMRRPPRVWIESLPRDHRGVSRLLRQLRR